MLNPEQPVARIGFFGPGSEHLYCLRCELFARCTDLATVRLQHCRNAVSVEYSQGAPTQKFRWFKWLSEQAERVSDFRDIRERLSLSANTAIHYLIDCHYDPQSQVWQRLVAACN